MKRLLAGCCWGSSYHQTFCGSRWPSWTSLTSIEERSFVSIAQCGVDRQFLKMKWFSLVLLALTGLRWSSTLFLTLEKVQTSVRHVAAARFGRFMWVEILRWLLPCGSFLYLWDYNLKTISGNTFSLEESFSFPRRKPLAFQNTTEKRKRQATYVLVQSSFWPRVLSNFFIVWSKFS